MKTLKTLAVIRSSGERTFQSCKNGLVDYLPKKDIIDVESDSFHSMLIKIFNMNINLGYDQILMVDADVVPKPKATKTFLENNFFTKKEIKIVQPLVYHKFINNFRYAGVHLYKRDFFDMAGEYLRSSYFDKETFFASDRPETYLKSKLLKNEDFSLFKRIFFGFEDFDQSYDDIFRKGAMFQVKNPSMTEKYSKKWQELAVKDRDFLVLLEGVEFGKCWPSEKYLSNNYSKALFSKFSKLSITPNREKHQSTVFEYEAKIFKPSIWKKLTRSKSYKSNLKKAPFSFKGEVRSFLLPHRI